MGQSITVKEWCEQYLSKRGSDWSDITRNSYRYLVQKHIVPGIGRNQMEQLTTQKIQKFYHRMEKEGLGGYSVQCVHLLLRRCLDEACREGLIQENPAKPYIVPQPEPLPDIPLRLGQIQRYLIVAEKQEVYRIKATF